MLLTGGLLCLAAGCSTFNHAWRKAEHQPTSPHSIEGRWEGRWLSDANGHKGRLRCLMSRQPDGDYAARFRASYLGFLRFGYTVRLKVETRDGVWHFRGEENLGKLAGGVYEYAGQASATNFHSTYRSRYDHGTFEMHRPDEASRSVKP